MILETLSSTTGCISIEDASCNLASGNSENIPQNTTLSTIGCSLISNTPRAVFVDLAKENQARSYIEAMSDEELSNFFEKIESKEAMISENNKVYEKHI